MTLAKLLVLSVCTICARHLRDSTCWDERSPHVENDQSMSEHENNN
jgi:hypothetical protein